MHFYLRFPGILFTLVTSMATREGLKKTNTSVLRALATDLGIDAKRKRRMI